MKFFVQRDSADPEYSWSAVSKNVEASGLRGVQGAVFEPGEFCEAGGSAVVTGKEKP